MARLHTVIDAPARCHAAQATFWRRALGWPVGDPWRDHPELRSFEPPVGDAYVHVQLVDAPPGVHLDIESSDASAMVARATDGGASGVGESERWTTLRSPGGLPFCVLPETEHVSPQPVSWPDGHRSRLVQLCIDSPVTKHVEEVRFWRELLGGRWAESDSPEFAGKWHDARSPIQLLFQRLDEPDGAVRAHIDLGTDDVAAETDRLLAAGAVDVGPGLGGWHTLRDPAALPFCVTGNAV